MGIGNRGLDPTNMVNPGLLYIITRTRISGTNKDTFDHTFDEDWEEFEGNCIYDPELQSQHNVPAALVLFDYKFSG